MEPYCITTAKEMLDIDKLPTTLCAKLLKVEKMIHKVKPGGSLGSTQTIATIILLWELEETIGN